MKQKQGDLHQVSGTDPPGSWVPLLYWSFFFLTIFTGKWALCKTASSHRSGFQTMLQTIHH